MIIKFRQIILFTVLAGLLCGCSGKKNLQSALVAEHAATGEKSDAIKAADGYAEGGIEQKLRTMWFDMIVHEAYLCNTYESYSAKDGMSYLVVNLTMENICGKNITMYDTDFQAQWGGSQASDFALPITVKDPKLRTGKMFGDEYPLDAKEVLTGDLVYEIPETQNKELSLSFREYFANDETGSVYFIFFDPQDRR